MPDPKALASMIEEVAHLKRRISDLEDAELEVMEQAETAVAERAALRERVADLDGRIAAVTARRDEQVGAIDGEAEALRSDRAAVVPEIPPDLLTLYTKLAGSHSGVGAAELAQRRCTGCQLEVNAADLRAIAAASDDEVMRCEECGRILVRTENSGL